MSLTADLFTLLLDMKETGEIDKATYDAVYQWGTTHASGEIFTLAAQPEPQLPRPEGPIADPCPLCGNPPHTHTHNIESKMAFIFVPKGVAENDFQNHIYVFEDNPDRLTIMRRLLADGATIRTWSEHTFIDGAYEGSFIW